MFEEVFEYDFFFDFISGLKNVELIDILNFAVSLASLLTAIWAIRISKGSLISASRPYLTLYLETVYAGNYCTYIILKNFGKSAAKLEEFDYPKDFEIASYIKGTEPFKGLEGNLIMPGQAFRSVINMDRLQKEQKDNDFHLTYSWNGKKYHEEIHINYNINDGNFEAHPDDKTDPLKIIAKTLEEAYKHQL